jgi:hypothetical protein
MVYIILNTATFPMTLKNPRIGSTVIHILNDCATAMALLLDMKKAKKFQTVSGHHNHRIKCQLIRNKECSTQSPWTGPNKILIKTFLAQWCDTCPLTQYNVLMHAYKYCRWANPVCGNTTCEALYAHYVQWTIQTLLLKKGNYSYITSVTAKWHSNYAQQIVCSCTLVWIIINNQNSQLWQMSTGNIVHLLIKSRSNITNKWQTNKWMNE